MRLSSLQARQYRVFLLACALWFARIPLSIAYFVRARELGLYAEDADNIAFPILATVLSVVVFLPFLLIFLTVTLRNAPAQYTWFAWSRRDTSSSIFYTLVFALLVYLTAVDMRENWELKLWWNAAANAGWILVWLETRAASVARLNNPEPAP